MTNKAYTHDWLYFSHQFFQADGGNMNFSWTIVFFIYDSLGYFDLYFQCILLHISDWLKFELCSFAFSRRESFSEHR